MNQFEFYSVLFILFNLYAQQECNKCNFFKNVSVIVTPKSQVPYFKQYVKNNFHGCLEQTQFDEVISDLSVVDQDIIEIGDHAVHDLLHLKSLSFTGCGIENISVMAFENLPELRVIHINNCKLRTISGGIFNDLPSLEDISLHANEISKISTTAFSSIRSLKQVILSSNKLHAIYNTWFIGSPNINLLDFRNNKIQKITKYTFILTQNLKDLFLDYNEIRSIGEKSFYNLSNMEILSLRHNRITELSPNIISNKFRVQVLRLNANFLNFLSGDLLKKLSVNVLELDGNPWKCPCLHQIHKWMRQSNVTLYHNGFCRGHHIPECSYDDNGNVCSETVDLKMTEIYLKTLKELERPVEEECANLT